MKHCGQQSLRDVRRDQGSHHPGVQHGVEFEIVNEAGTAQHFVRQVNAGQVLGRGRGEFDLQRRIADADVEVDGAREVGVRPDGGTVGGHEYPRHQPDLRRLEPGLLRGRATEQLTRLGAHPPHRGTGERDRQAACREAFIRRRRRIRRRGAHGLGWDVELVGGDLCQGGENALSEFDFAGAQCDGAVVGDGQPGGDPRIGDE